MKKDLTELVFILDQSGSMSGLEADTIGGFNSLIDKQKEEDGEVVVTTVLFNDEMDIIHDRVDIKEVKEMTRKDYCPGGCTALLDAVGHTVLKTARKHKELKEEYVPSKTMVIITTDGMENASRDFTYPKIKKIIDKQKELGWEFIFLGANIDAVHEAYKFGIIEERAVNYKCDKKGVNLNYEALDCAIKSMRTEGKIDSKWRDEIDKDYENRKNR